MAHVLAFHDSLFERVYFVDEPSGGSGLVVVAAVFWRRAPGSATIVDVNRVQWPAFVATACAPATLAVPTDFEALSTHDDLDECAGTEFAVLSLSLRELRTARRSYPLRPLGHVLVLLVTEAHDGETQVVEHSVELPEDLRPARDRERASSVGPIAVKFFVPVIERDQVVREFLGERGDAVSKV